MKNIRQEQIIELCKYHGFESQLVYGLPYKHSTDAKENLRYLLWLTEIANWLTERLDFQFFFESRPLTTSSLEYEVHKNLKDLKDIIEGQKKTLKTL